MDKFDVQNPITGEVLYAIEGPSDKQISNVFQAAAEAQHAIAQRSVQDRINEVRRLSDWI